MNKPTLLMLLFLSACSTEHAQLVQEDLDLALGRQLYEQRCASCHEVALDRTPSRQVLSGNTPNFIYSAINNGVMAPMAEGLSQEEKQAIALYISPAVGARGTAGDPDANAIWGPSSAQMPMDGPMCTEDLAQLDLRQPQWSGWSIGPDNARYQPDPGFSVEDIPRLKVKWAFHYPGSKNGQATVIGRESPHSLYDQDLVTFEEGVQAYDHRDAEGFIKLNALRLRVLARRDARAGSA